MALATTCPQCKTSFKVVPDQLKLRRGLVRCGVCQHVFSGVEHLRYVDRDENAEQPDQATSPSSGPDGGTTKISGHSSPSQETGTQTTAVSQPADPLATTPSDIGSQTEQSEPAPPLAPATGSKHAPETTASPPAQQPPTSAASPAEKGKRRGRNRSADATQRTGPLPSPPPASPQTATRAPLEPVEDDDIKTVFFMADSDLPLPGHNSEANVQLPSSLRNTHTRPSKDDPLDPDTRAAGALIDAANRIWRQQKPRQAEAGPIATPHGETPHDPSVDSPSHGIEGQTSPPPSTASSGSNRATSRRSGHGRRRSHRSPRSSEGSRNHRQTGWLTASRRRPLLVALTAIAIIQLLAVFRTEIAYNTPFLRPIARVASVLTGQDISPPMNLGALSIESFELRNTRHPGKTRMTAILRNRSTLPTRWPAMELTLTGPSNAIVVRKVLQPAQYLPNLQVLAAGMPPNSEQPLDLLLETNDLNLAGYSVGLFYP